MQVRKGTIFINYRKDDSNWNALALYQELQKYFSKDQIFKDFNAISPGDDFVISINNALQACDVLLVLIGKNWLEMKDESGNQRLADPNDFVRLEISKALERNIKVVPVLLDRTPMPRVADLPDNLKALCRRQFVEIDPTRFEDDVRKLTDAIRNVMQNGGAEDLGTVRPQHTAPPPVQQTVQSSAWQSQNQYQQSSSSSNMPMPPKPDNNLVWAILTTLLCCLPVGIFAILQAAKVDGLYSEGKYQLAQEAAAAAKKLSIWAAVIGGVGAFLYILFAAASIY